MIIYSVLINYSKYYYKKKINAAGTIRVNRFNKPNFSSDTEMRKKGRGSSEEFTSRDGSIVLVKWQGGVDLLDQYMSYYRIFIKFRKWTLRVIFHFIDLAMCASFLEYRNTCSLQITNVYNLFWKNWTSNWFFKIRTANVGICSCGVVTGLIMCDMFEYYIM